MPPSLTERVAHFVSPTLAFLGTIYCAAAPFRHHILILVREVLVLTALALSMLVCYQDLPT